MVGCCCGWGGGRAGDVVDSLAFDGEAVAVLDVTAAVLRTAFEDEGLADGDVAEVHALLCSRDRFASIDVVPDAFSVHPTLCVSQ